MFERTFQREATRGKERTKAPYKAMGTPVPLECDLERCSLESTRNHLDSVESSDSPPARDGVTQNGAEGNPVKEGDSHPSPTSQSPVPIHEKRLWGRSFSVAGIPNGTYHKPSS